MRIESASFVDSLENGATVNARSPQHRARADATQSAVTNKVANAKTEQGESQNEARNQESPLLPQIPQYEVKVQFDKQMNDGILIYQFLDKQSGNLVMQLPSTQVLSVVHEIQSELQQSVSGHAAEQLSAMEPARGGDPDGN